MFFGNRMPDRSREVPGKKGRGRWTGVFCLGLVGLLIMVSSATADPIARVPSSSLAGDHAAEVAEELGLAANYSDRVGWEPPVYAGVREAHPLPPSTPIQLGITLIPSDPAALADAVNAGPSGVASRGSGGVAVPAWAPSTSSYEQVVNALRAGGLTVQQTFPDHLFLSATGPASDVDRLFSTTLEGGWESGKFVRFPASLPVIPPSLVPFVLTVTGLDSGFTTFSFDLQGLRPLSLGTPSVTYQGSLVTWNTPHAIYNISQLYNLSGTPRYASGTTIGILLWGDGYSPADISNFLANYYPSSEPPFHVYYYNYDGAPPPSSSAPLDPSLAPAELTLDIEWAGSQAPGANILAVYGPDGNATDQYSPSPAQLETGLAYLVDQANVTVITQSFGTPDGADPSFQTAMNYLYEAAAARGISVFAASGDNGGTKLSSSGGCTAIPQPDFPASSPYVTAVGGTAPVLSQTLGGNLVMTSQPAWKFSGGGFSALYAAPYWQTSSTAGPLISSEGGGMRGIPDVAGPAGYDTLYFNGTLEAGDGTSFASPLWAGLIDEMVALQGNHFGLLDPRLYAIGSSPPPAGTAPAFYDVTEGETPGQPANCLYNANPGWDPVTGWGTPDSAPTLYGELRQALASVHLNVTPGVVTPGGVLSVRTVVTNSTGPVPDVNVTFEVWSDPAFLGHPSELVAAVAPTDSSGTATVRLQVPWDYLYSRVTVVADAFSARAVGSAEEVVVVSWFAGSWGSLGSLLSYPTDIFLYAAIMSGAIAIGWALGRRKGRRPPGIPTVPRPSGPSSPSETSPPRLDNGPLSGTTGAPDGASGASVPRGP
jgi:hypothetical protein